MASSADMMIGDFGDADDDEDVARVQETLFFFSVHVSAVKF